ncbi:LytTr DNA-binding domain-containing protein [Spirosomataceae bacterium TFI 002]|nr:LytTr DNA-binding domain-containing protein [Spirosomataceae bacterium TFI 002]
MKTHTLAVNYGKKKLPVSNIKYIESVFGNYSRIHLCEGEDYLSSFTLKHYQEQLRKTDRFRLGRKGLLINIEHLKMLTEDDTAKYAILKSGETFKLSRRKGKSLEVSLKLS